MEVNEPLDAQEAREHLAMVDRILAAAEPPSISGWPFLLWGIVAAAINAGIQQALRSGSGVPALMWIAAVLLIFAIFSMMIYGLRRRRAERRSALDSHISGIFFTAWIVCMVAMLGANRIFADWGQGGLWSLMYGSAMMYVAHLARSRIVFAGGAVLILSILAANLQLHAAGYILAAGDLIGMAGTGAALMFAQRSHDG